MGNKTSKECLFRYLETYNIFHDGQRRNKSRPRAYNGKYLGLQKKIISDQVRESADNYIFLVLQGRFQYRKNQLPLTNVICLKQLSLSLVYEM